MFAAVAAIMLGMRNLQGPAALFLMLAFIGCLVTLVSYKRYALLRKHRWQSELAGTENALNQVLNHTRMNIIMEHVTGPLGPAMVDADQDTTARDHGERSDTREGEEPPLAKP
jgi:hypothetical protein